MTTRLVMPLDGSCGLPAAVVGGKAHAIDLMRRQGLPVPPAFCLTTTVGAQFRERSTGVPAEVWDGVRANLGRLEAETGRSFGCGPDPLLVSVRGGGAHSMPGMLATLVNVGINTPVRDALAAAHGADVADDIRHRFEHGYRKFCADPAPADPLDQLRTAITAVFSSWDAEAPLAYRRRHGIDDSAGTAVVVQAMVFGNLTADSGAGVVFSGNPVTGGAERFGEWTPGRQGTDLVSGLTDGRPLTELARTLPGVHRALLDAVDRLAGLAGDVVEVEFTVEAGSLWVLQFRKAPAPPSPETGVEPGVGAPVLVTGVPACPGVAVGRAYTDVQAALDAADRGEQVILVRPTTSPADVAGIFAARGLVTEIGGVTSHAAVISREIGRPAVLGCGAGSAATLAGRTIAVDGTAGEVRAADEQPCGI